MVQGLVGKQNKQKWILYKMSSKSSPSIKQFCISFFWLKSGIKYEIREEDMQSEIALLVQPVGRLETNINWDIYTNDNVNMQS